jgi:uncharacterized protein involved in exopolysaccharide biosynthesis
MQPDPAKAAAMLGAFRGGLSVHIIPNSRLVEISYTHPDPRLATEIVNALVKTFVEENFKTKYDSVTQTSDWLSTELADLQLTVQTSEEKLVRYQKDHSILGVDETANGGADGSHAKGVHLQAGCVWGPRRVPQNVHPRDECHAGEVAGKGGGP